MIAELVWAHIGAIKALAIMVGSALVGFALWLLQGATGGGSASQTIISSILGGGGVAVLIKLIDVIMSRNSERKQGKQKQIASAERVLEIETDEKELIRQEARRLRREAKQIADEKILFSKAAEFEARARAIRFGGEVMRLQAIIIGLQNVMASAQPPIPIPEIKLNQYAELMYGTLEQQREVADQIEAYRQQMIREDARADDPHTTFGTTSQGG